MMLNLLELENSIIALLRPAIAPEVQVQAYPDEWDKSGRVHMRGGVYVRATSVIGNEPNKAILSLGADARLFTCNVQITAVSANLRPTKQSSLYTLLDDCALAISWTRPIEHSGRLCLLNYADSITRKDGYWQAEQSYSIALPKTLLRSG
jgi:hypothetical protein